MNNRFDESFNDVDRTTGRPFSWGHPDGVWIIAILYSLPVLGTIARALLTLVFSQNARLSVELVAPILITCALYIPALVLLFRRSKMAIIWMAFLAALFLALGVVGGVRLDREGQLSTAALFGIAAAVVSQGYITFYTFRLKRDFLLR